MGYIEVGVIAYLLILLYLARKISRKSARTLQSKDL
jgi:hypothetical protein